jgi:hypothetical protein
MCQARRRHGELQARHVGVVHSGRLAIRHEDGTEVEIGPGEAYVIEPGHDACVLGDERFVGYESPLPVRHWPSGPRWAASGCGTGSR